MFAFLVHRKFLVLIIVFFVFAFAVYVSGMLASVYDQAFFEDSLGESG